MAIRVSAILKSCLAFSASITRRFIRARFIKLVGGYPVHDIYITKVGYEIRKSLRAGLCVCAGGLTDSYWLNVNGGFAVGLSFYSSPFSKHLLSRFTILVPKRFA